MPKRIDTGSPEGDALGFTDSLFSGWLEIFEDNRIYLYFVISRRKNEGNTQRLISRWLQDGYDIRIVKPRAIMQHIIEKLGFVQAYEYLPAHYDDHVEVWRKSPVSDSFTHIHHPHPVKERIGAAT